MALSASDLRIGNWVNGNKPYQVTITELVTQDYHDKVTFTSYLEPIPLTEDWLLKFGFEKINHIHGYSFYSLSKSKKHIQGIEIYERRTAYKGFSVKHCEYVHQLQNLYYALTGQELCTPPTSS